MNRPSSDQNDFAQRLINRVESLLLDAESQTRPVEVDPFRKTLFQLFAEASASGLLNAESGPDLSCDAIGHELAIRWELRDVAVESANRQTKIPPDKLSRMRLMWSFMRMWMEWTYAWEHWHEFHTQQHMHSESGAIPSE